MLEGKVALVTGAGQGIGRAIAEAMAKAGAKVVINDLEKKLAERVASRLAAAGYQTLAVAADVSSSDEVRNMLAGAVEHFGLVDILVNNAGVVRYAPAVDTDEMDWDHVFAINCKGTFLCCRETLRQMVPRRSGRIINISSIAGLIVRIKHVHYSSAKAAVVHLTRSLAVEVAPYGITVNCICPGMTVTDMLVKIMKERGTDLEAWRATIPTGRFSTPEDHAQLAVFLASAAAAQITGQVICVDGGQSLNVVHG